MPNLLVIAVVHIINKNMSCITPSLTNYTLCMTEIIWSHWSWWCWNSWWYNGNFFKKVKTKKANWRSKPGRRISKSIHKQHKRIMFHKGSPFRSQSTVEKFTENGVKKHLGKSWHSGRGCYIAIDDINEPSNGGNCIMNSFFLPNLQGNIYIDLILIKKVDEIQMISVLLTIAFVHSFSVGISSHWLL